MLYTTAVNKMDKITPLRELREGIIRQKKKKTNKVIADCGKS